MNWETYIAFGDSITIGARSYLGYPEVAGDKLEKTLSKQWNVINCAKSGITAIELARLIDLNYANLAQHQSSITTILIGTNDVKNDVPVAHYEVALNQIIIKAKLLTQRSNVVLIEIPALRNGIMYPYTIEMNAAISAYNKSIQRLAEKHQLKYLALDLNETHFYDGVHLNASGVECAGEQITNFILKERGL